MSNPPPPQDWMERTQDDDSPIVDTPEVGLYLVIVLGTEQGRRFRLKPHQTLTLGRSADAEVVLNDNRVSSVHCRITRTPSSVTVEDNNSRNGTFVDEKRVQRATLRLESQLRVGHSVFRIEFKSDVEITREEDLFKAATTDPLTRVPNRRWFAERAREELEASKRHNRPLCLVMLDVDHFKSINDTHGHPIGDYVLASLAGLLCNRKRVEDFLCRYGGEEFVLLLRETTLDNAMIFCERVRATVEQNPFVCGEINVPVTISIGISVVRPDDTLDQLIQRADDALYAAKEHGRNRIEKEALGNPGT